MKGLNLVIYVIVVSLKWLEVNMVILCADGLTGIKDSISLVSPNNNSLLKVLYLSTFEATKKWILRLINWGKVYGELSIMYEYKLILKYKLLLKKHHFVRWN